MLRLVHWVLFILLILAGVLKMLLIKFGVEKGNKLLTGSSMVLGIVAVLVLAMAREAYATVVVFLLLVVKGILLLK